MINGPGGIGKIPTTNAGVHSQPEVIHNPGVENTDPVEVSQTITSPNPFLSPDPRLCSLFIDYASDIKSIVQEIEKNSYEMHNGTINNLNYKVTFPSRGKQQKVVGLEITFPQNVIADCVLRVDQHHVFNQYYASSPAVRKHFPTLFSSVESRQYPHLILERLHGLEERTSGSTAFIDLIKHEHRFKQLVNDTVVQMDDLLKDKFYVSDISLLYAHNIFYNERKDCFQFYDIDTLKHDPVQSDKLLILRSLSGLNLNIRIPESRKLAFELIKSFAERYPDFTFTINGLYERVSYFFIREDSLAMPKVKREGRIIEKGTKEYNDECIKLSFFHRVTPKDGEVMASVTDKIPARIFIQKELVDACKNNDFNTFNNTCDEIARSSDEHNKPYVIYETTYQTTNGPLKLYDNNATFCPIIETS